NTNKMLLRTLGAMTPDLIRRLPRPPTPQSLVVQVAFPGGLINGAVYSSTCARAGVGWCLLGCGPHPHSRREGIVIQAVGGARNRPGVDPPEGWNRGLA